LAVCATHQPQRPQSTQSKIFLGVLCEFCGDRLHHYEPLSRIVCRPRPSRYAISIDSAPIFKMRYCPATTSPSRPWSECPVESTNAAIRFACVGASTIPMNLSGIGGGGAGPGGATGVVRTGIAGVAGGAGGGGFGLNRNRLRSPGI